ncbi:MAG: hypothetical protein ACRDID_14855 [Ktedonobacterales bacterium]
MEENRTTLAAEIAAELEFALPTAASSLAEKLQLSETLRATLKRFQLIRSLALPGQHLEHDTTTHDVCGVAASVASLPAFGGLLYGTIAHAHRLHLRQRAILDASEQARVHVGDLDFYESGERLHWLQTRHLYELIDELLAEREPPRILLLDQPLFISRGQEGNREMIEEVEEELVAMSDTVNGFWKRNLPKLYPLASEGVSIASLSTQNPYHLFVALHNNPATSPDPVAPEAPTFIRSEWKRLRKSGMARLLDGLLTPGSRSVAYAFEDLKLDPRWQPTELHHSGILSFYLRAGPQTPIWQVQIAGHRTQWTSERLDALALAICQVTLGTGRKAEPLPLWYARRLAIFPHSMLEVFRDLAQERLMLEATPSPEQTR